MTQLYISADIEGVAGVVNRDQAGNGCRDFSQGRQWMTDEVIAACEAARARGIDRVVISDSHGTGDNILIDQLPDYVEIVRSWPRELMMMQGIECGEFLGAAFIGFHAGSRSAGGVLAHTMSGEIIELTLNGIVQSETTFNAALGGHFGVPLIMASGDDVYTRHVADAFPGVPTATVKWAHGVRSARTLTPRAACTLIGERMTEALNRAAMFKPMHLDGPIDVEIEFSTPLKAEVCSYVPTVERISSHRIKMLVEDMIAVSRFIALILQIKPSY